MNERSQQHQGDPRPSELELERFVLGELPVEQMDALRRRMSQEDPGGVELARRVAEIETSNAEILARYPAEGAVPLLRGKLAQARRGRGSTPWLAVMAVGAAAASGMLWVRSQPASDAPPPEAILLKGDAALVVARRRGAETSLLQAGDAARAGDLVQLAYRSGGARFGVIASIDSSGGLTQHLPETGDAAAALATAGPTSLPHAYELDATPGVERFYFVTGDAPFAVAPVLAALRERREGAPTLPDGLRLTSFELRKEGPR